MALTMQKVIIALLLAIIIVVAAFNIVASLTMIVLSKVREIAILKSMGARVGDGCCASSWWAAASSASSGPALGIVFGLLGVRAGASSTGIRSIRRSI